MFKLFPSEYVKNVSFVDLKALWDSGKRGIVIDIDNTICKDEQFEIEPFAIKFIKTAKKIGFKICLMSNNSLTRVQPIGKALDCLYHYKARKPHRSAYETCLKKIGVPVEKAVMIGDQLFTDIYGANRVGMYSIMVQRIDPHEIMQIRFKRPLEKVIMTFFRDK